MFVTCVDDKQGEYTLETMSWFEACIFRRSNPNRALATDAAFEIYPGKMTSLEESPGSLPLTQDPGPNDWKMARLATRPRTRPALGSTH